MNQIVSSAHLLHVWDQGQAGQPYQAVKLLLEAMLPPEARETIDSWTIGQRDGQLLQVRERLFGQQMACIARCPQCSEQAEFTLSTIDLRQPVAEPSAPLSLQANGYGIDYHLPTLADLDQVAALDDRRAALLQRCIIRATHHGKDIDAGTLPDALLDQIAASMGEVDAQAFIELDLVCPACAAPWQAPFDIVSYLWQEFGSWARRIQREVHIIATAYGWSEKEILQLSPIRRQAYMNLILET